MIKGILYNYFTKKWDEEETIDQRSLFSVWKVETCPIQALVATVSSTYLRITLSFFVN